MNIFWSLYISNHLQHKLILGESVGQRLHSEALCFGGGTCTATDVAVAAGVASLDICHVSSTVLESLNPMMVYTAISYIREMIESGSSSVKVSQHYC